METSIEHLVEEEIGRGTFPGIVALVRKEGKSVLSLVRGKRQLEPSPEQMTEETLFDLASVTKPLCTALLTLHLTAQEKIALDRCIGEFVPLKSRDTAGITLRQLLLHTGGLPPVPDVYLRFPDPDRIDPREAEKFLLAVEPEQAADREVLYSCTGYLLLAQFLKKLSGRRLARLFAERIAGPCGIEDLLFNPGTELEGRCAATEFCRWRKRWIRGQVHDENAYCLGGDGGNAGLFGTAGSVLELLGLFSSQGFLNGIQLLRPEEVRLMRTCFTEGLNFRRSIGFRMQDEEVLMGPLFGPSSFGHTGFTGTSVWIDPEQRLEIVVLTNRVHLGREPTDAKLKAFRKKIHSAIRRRWGGTVEQPLPHHGH